MTPLQAVLVVVALGVLDLILGFVLALKGGTTSLQKLPSWLQTTVLPYIVPSVSLWVPQILQPDGSFDSKALAVVVYGAVVTATPKLAQDCARKLMQLVGATA